MKKTFKFKLSNFMVIDDLNDILEDTLQEEGKSLVPIDISYSFKNITKDGEITVEANFKK